ncbi:hypothetical protein CEXT_354481 [Caerostris extrusa]|uniref:Uncharacterized protein n=1 Tax=Caerostris extrusa TaxID=172846 RepID=A0AAV4XCD8_CAEEX|nr:hypothetical protein CEXT_354481 [Caerostris extrusa]
MSDGTSSCTSTSLARALRRLEEAEKRCRKKEDGNLNSKIAQRDFKIYVQNIHQRFSNSLFLVDVSMVAALVKHDPPPLTCRKSCHNFQHSASSASLISFLSFTATRELSSGQSHYRITRGGLTYLAFNLMQERIEATDYEADVLPKAAQLLHASQGQEEMSNWRASECIHIRMFDG